MASFVGYRQVIPARSGLEPGCWFYATHDCEAAQSKSPCVGNQFSQPSLVQSVLQSVQTTVHVAGTILAALLSSAGEVIMQQPTLIGWLLVMMGIVFLWGGVYRQLSTVSPNR
jgi:hypothetical protein